MSPVYVKNGTPVTSASICESCNNAHILRGFRDSEEVVYCSFAYPMILVPFKVRDCSNHWDKNRPTWRQMEDLAIEIRPSVSFKPIGFQPACDDEDVAADEAEVATKR
jgi:hypothetical protein